MALIKELGRSGSKSKLHSKHNISISGVEPGAAEGLRLTSWMHVQPKAQGGSDPLKYWHIGVWLTYWRDVHPFLSVVLICSNTGERLTCWIGVHTLSSVVLICSNTEEGLTCWMGVHSFSSVVLICSNTGESSQTGGMLTLSCQWFWAAQTQKRDSQSGWVFTHSLQ